jgi:hypothetical protein
MEIKYFIGPMSKNVVDAIVEFCKETGNIIAFIPSRRQVEWDGGYVNNWTTEEFSKYVTTLPLQRDHGGPGQGNNDDDGFESLAYDAKHFQLIHIDPWKKYPGYVDGLEQTIKMIKFAFIILLMNLSQMAWSVCGKPIKEKPSSYSKFNTTYSSFKDNPFKEFEKNKILICTCNVNRKYISEDGTEKEVSENHFLQVITTNEMNEHAISALDDRCAKLQASFNKGEEVPLKKKFEHSDDNIKKVEILQVLLY